MVKALTLFLALAPALILGVPVDGDETSTGATSTGTESSASNSSGSSSATPTTNTGSASTGSKSGNTTATASGSATSSVAAIAASTHSIPAAPTSTQGRIAGPEFKPHCDMIQGPPEDDWLYTSICSRLNISKGDWTTMYFSPTVKGFDLKEEAMDVQITIYPFGDNNHHFKTKNPTIKYDEGKNSGNADPANAWFAGGYREAVRKETKDLVDAEGKLDAKAQRDWAGYYAASYLSGFTATRENVTALPPAMWNMFLDKVSTTPVTALSRNDTAQLVADRYYSVLDFKDGVATVWDSTIGGADAYHQIPAKALQNELQWLYHLDWPGYVQIDPAE